MENKAMLDFIGIERRLLAKGIETHKNPHQIKDVPGCRVELTM
jgi:hypothetical protein